MNNFRRFFIAVLLSGMPILTSAATTTSSSNLAFSLDNQGTSARAIAMGSAFVAVSGDASALPWNPAALATLPNAQLALHHNFYLQDYLQETLVFALPPGPLGSWGLSASYLYYGTLQGRDSTGAPTGAVDAGRWGGEIAWASKLFPPFSIGLGLKGNLLNVAGTSYANITGDAGLLLQLAKGFNLGASYSNVGSNVNVYPTNSVVRLGGAYSLSFSPSQKALLAVSAAWEPLGVTRLNFGAEDLIGSFLAIRAGYNLDLADENLQGLTGLMAGLGFQLKDFILDYSYSPFGDLGSSQRISLSYQFDGPAPKSKPAPARPRTLPIPVSTPIRPLTLPQVLPAAVFATEAPSPTPTPLPVEIAPGQDAEKLKLQFSFPEGQANGVAILDPVWNQKVQDQKDNIDKDPRDEKAWYALGMLYYQKGLKADAIQCFEQVLRLKPGNQRLRDWLAAYRKRQSP